MPPPHLRSSPRPALHRPLAALVATVTVLVVAACAYAPDQAVLVQNTTVTTGNEFSGIVASPNHPGWYWAIRDVWKQEADPSQGIGALPEGSPDPVPSWCPAGDQASATGRNRCRRVERSSLYAIRLDAAGAVAEVRRVPLTDESWAEQPWRAENNDWEELSLGPTRVLGGVPTTTLLVGATGDGTKNPSKVESPPGSGTWVSVQCTTRRFIETPEPDPATATSWLPHRIFDLADYSSQGTNCNSEAAVAVDGATPEALWIAKRSVRTIWSRDLSWSAGRDPATQALPTVAPDPAAPAKAVQGSVQGVDAGPLFTGLAFNGGRAALITSTLDAGSSCQAWTFEADGVDDLVALLTTVAPAPMVIHPEGGVCKGGAEGVTFTRDLASPPQGRNTLFLIRDTGTTGVLGVRVPWTGES